MADVGDKIKLVTKQATYEGILMPRPEFLGKGYTIIKLVSGYNISIDDKKIEKIEVVEKLSKKEAKSKTVKKNSKLPTISILHTGGTIASKVDYRTGGVNSTFSPSELVGLFPELADIANIDSELIANMWSDDFRFAHLKMIAKTIEKHVKKGSDGIIIGMGTDNLAVAAAGLAFVLEESPVPVIFVGAQRSSDRPSTDAAMNLICAAEFIVNTDFTGVAVCMHSGADDTLCSILPATKTKKMHTSRRDAFKPVNDTEIALVDYKTRKVEQIKKDISKGKKLVIKSDFEEKVGLLKISINMFPEQFEFYKGWKGLVIEGTGLGQAPGQVPNEECNIHKKIYPAIKSVIDSGCVVVMTSNCINGRVNMNVYDKGRDLQELGIIPGEDMLTDTAFVKLSWLLANEKNPKELVRKNLRGEINERILQ